MEDRETQLASFMALTNTEAEFAKSWLEDHKWDVERSIGAFLDLNAEQDGMNASSAPEPFEEPPVPVAPSHADDYFKQEVLLEPAGHNGMAALAGLAHAGGQAARVRDPFRNFQSEAGAADAEDDPFAKMFQPPTDIMFVGTFEKAKEYAAQNEKWLLVNIQSHTEFPSHMLNRDTWSESKVKHLIQTHFVFWQQYSTSPGGLMYCGLHASSSLPQIDIIDPATGGRCAHWEGFEEPGSMADKLTAFVHDHEWGEAVPIALQRGRSGSSASAPVDVAPETSTANVAGTVGVDDDADLQEAIRMSFHEAGGGDIEGVAAAAAASAEGNGRKRNLFGEPVHANAGLSGPDGALRQQQDSEYKMSLLADREKDRRRSEEEEIAAAIAMSEEQAALDEAHQRKAKASALPPEPEEGAPGCATLMLRLTDGSRRSRRFNETDTVQNVWDFLDSIGIPSASHQVATARPRVVLTDGSTTLVDAHLTPQGVLFVERAE